MNKLKIKKYFGFTLVELIIVITILAILSTIAFVSFQGYTSQTRDTKRLSDLSQISKGVEVFQIGAGITPTPDNPKTLTGGNSTLLVGKINSKVLKSLSNNILDPVSGTEYTYATIGNGKYYQIGADSENLVTSIFQNTFADAKSSIVKGNYLFDPSLPSLIISSGSNLYDPNNCFVINGGTNLISNSINCTPKSSSSLKNFDSSLVGYWDMESLTGTMLKDLSGNGNDGIFSGTLHPSSTGGYIGSGYYFSGGYINIADYSTKGQKIGKEATFNFVLKGYSGSLLGKRIGSTKVDYIIYNNPSITPGKSHITFHGTDGSGTWWNQNTTENPIIDENTTFYKNIRNYYFLSIVFNNGNKKIYKNGIEIGSINKYFPQEELTTSTGILQIGSRGSTSSLFYGIIDDVKIYNRALSDEEILQQAKSAGF